MLKKIILSSFVLSVSIFASTWDVNIKKDKMSGEISTYASSSTVTSDEKMRFPYSNTKSWIGVGCKDGKEWAYFGFTESPNLLNTETQSGYSILYAKIKIGKTVDKIKLLQEWGDRFLSITNNAESFIEKLKQGKSILLELNWHGNGKTYFTYSLQGSTKALTKLQNECGFTKKKKKLEMIANMSKEEKKIYESKIFCNKEYGGWKLNENGNVECK